MPYLSLISLLYPIVPKYEGMCQNKRNIQYYIILHTYAYGQIRARQHTYSHGFIFVFAINRIACAGSATRARRKRAPETRAGNATRAPETRAPKTRAPKTRRGHADHLRTDAPRDTPPHADTAHHTPTHAPVSGALLILFGLPLLHDSKKF